MKIRLMGTAEECATGVAALRWLSGTHPALDIVEVSEPVPNRGDSALVRVYVEARVPQPTVDGER